MMPKRKQPTPEEIAEVERLAVATADVRARIAAGEEPHRPGIRGKVVKPEPAEQDGTEGRVGRS